MNENHSEISKPLKAHDKKSVSLILILGALLLIGAIIAYLLFFQNSKGTINPALSEDSKAIRSNGNVLLTIDHDSIFRFFQNESQLCDAANINSKRELFCENKTAFKEMTRFDSIVVSPDKKSIVFTIKSDVLSPDTVVGIFYPFRSGDNIYFLTNYYLGNQFISFSPNGSYFIYKGNCWEAMCGLYIKETETLTEALNINDPEYIDLRTQDAEFIRWVSENTIEYQIGSDRRQESF